MEAIVVREWGGPEVLKEEHIQDPPEHADRVIVKLHAVSVNWHDVLVRRTGRGFALPNILGIDGAGIRRDTREEVIIYPGLNWGNSERTAGPRFEILGDESDGTYAELLSIPKENIFPKPRRLSWEEAAAIPTAGVTAYRALFSRAKAKRGETVLVLGSGSGVSTFAVSLAAAAGLRVIVTSSKEVNIEHSRELGAERGVLYTKDGWPEEIRSITGGGVDVVVDGVGNLKDSLACLRPGGRLVVFGASGSASAMIDVPSFYFSHASILASTLGSPRDFARLLAALEEWQCRPVIDSVRPLGDVALAHESMERREHLGKLVLAV